MNVTIIIAHLNDAPGLADTLEALAPQLGDCDTILVVDNGSECPPEALCDRYRPVRLIHEAQPGPGPARNAGVAAAGTGVLAFTDADCRPAPGWLEAIRAAFADPACQMIGGPIVVPYSDPPRFHEDYERVYSFRNRSYIEKQGYSAAANLAVRSKVFEAVGGFKGRSFAEDLEWGQRATQGGFALRFVAQMIVHHPPRPSLRALLEKWDRHIAHDFAARPQTLASRAVWGLRALAVLASTPLEIRVLATTDAVSGVKARLRAFAGVLIVRTYRGLKMLRLLPQKADKIGFRWNNGGG